ncbi:nuclear transport factor 2 family protein [Algiphilus sp. W345]|uniref:Nuclear transport factor 2 family protein n=1 Tax=Banduia mediterranea TaxID=3075609 RepID=A0ABU2WG02_9GAMM|nr:nuclear transport factor 2 family protein [Algiphilus sp. W345]MDT0496803.1 nuclear transport factor 2 family protein [Algiphilus sp. W345]
MKRVLLWTGLCAMLLSGAVAHAAQTRPADIVDGFRKAVLRGNADEALGMLASDVVIYEQGFSEFDRREYAGDHLAADIQFEKSIHRAITWRQVFQDEVYAFVISEYRLTGDLDGEPLNIATTETMVLRRDAQSWKIAHIHLSSHSVDQ